MKNKRIKLVPPSMVLVPSMLEAVKESHRELERYLTWVPFTLTVEGATQSMEEAIENFEHFKGSLRYFILHKETGRFLGSAGIIIRDQAVPYYEIGYWLRTSEYGNGYVTDAVNLLEKYAFNELEANRVEIRVAEDNHKSRYVAERCGYALEAILENERRLPSGELSNTAVYRKLGFFGGC